MAPYVHGPSQSLSHPGPTVSTVFSGSDQWTPDFRNCTAKVTKRPAHTHLNAAARTRICIRMDHGCVCASDVDPVPCGAAGCWPLRRAQSAERKGRFQNFVEGKEPTLGPRRACRCPTLTCLLLRTAVAVLRSAMTGVRRSQGLRARFPRGAPSLQSRKCPHRATGQGRAGPPRPSRRLPRAPVAQSHLRRRRCSDEQIDDYALARQGRSCGGRGGGGVRREQRRTRGACDSVSE